MDYKGFRELLASSDKGYHHGYHRFYYPILRGLEKSNVRFLEIGVADGRSMKIWNQYFVNAEHLYGIGYKNHQTVYQDKIDEKNTLFMGDQSDTEFLKRFIGDSGGCFDIVIDDGSHVPSHVKTSFETLWDCVNPNGYYIIEDIETSYWKKSASIYGYSLSNEPSIVEYFKSKVDDVNNEFRKRESTDIAMISFVQNAIIIQKIGEDHEPYMNRRYRYGNNLN